MTKNTIIVITSILSITFIGCKENSNSNKHVENNSKEEIIKIENKDYESENIVAEKDKRVKELEILSSYKELSDKSITDNDGFVQTYSIDKEYGNKIHLGSTGQIRRTNPDNGKWTAYELKVSLREVTNKLKINGELQISIKTFEQIYFIENKYNWGFNEVQRNMPGSERANDPIILTYSPDFEKKEKRNEIFKTLDYKFAGYEKVKNKWKQEYTRLIKNSGILNINSHKEFLEFTKNSERNNKISNKLEKSIESKNSNENIEIIKISVDNLRVRTSPELDGEKIENLAINTKVELIEKSTNKTTVTIENNEITEYWYKIKTPSGNIGWIHGCCFVK